MGRRKVTPEQIRGLAADVEAGLTLQEAAIANGLNYGTLRNQLTRGRNATRGVNREVYLAVRQAQSQFIRATMAALFKAAKEGNPTAVNKLLTRSSAAATDLEAEEAPTEIKGYLEHRLADIRRRMADAQGIAYNQLMSKEEQLVSRLHELTKEEGEELTDEEYFAELQREAEEMNDAELDVYAKVWMARNHVKVDHLRVLEGGA